MARFAITTSPNPMGKDGVLKEIFAQVMVDGVTTDGAKLEPIGTSVRESRAKRHARKLVSAGRKNVMLWRVDGARPVPIRYREQKVETRYATHNGCNSTAIDITSNGLIDREKAPGRSMAAKMDFIRRRNRSLNHAMEVHSG